jgi:hypothetical protein
MDNLQRELLETVLQGILKAVDEPKPEDTWNDDGGLVPVDEEC